MLKVEVVTPSERLIEVECEAITLPGSAGEMQILEGHTPILSGLKAGKITILSSNMGNKIEIESEAGVVESNHTHVSVLCEGASIVKE